MRNKDIIGVALVKEACPLCGKPVDGQIILNQRLTKGEADKVKAMHGETVGYLDGPCDECKDMMSQGILLIGVVEAKTDDPKNPYRSGNNWVVTEDFINRCFGDSAPAILDKGVAFFSVEAADQMGFPDCNLNA